jgi:hypothetical protein
MMLSTLPISISGYGGNEMNLAEPLLTSWHIDRLLRYPHGRSVRLARRGLIPCVKLPDGEIRFDRDIIERWLRECSVEGGSVNDG